MGARFSSYSMPEALPPPHGSRLSPHGPLFPPTQAPPALVRRRGAPIAKRRMRGAVAAGRAQAQRAPCCAARAPGRAARAQRRRVGTAQLAHAQSEEAGRRGPERSPGLLLLSQPQRLSVSSAAALAPPCPALRSRRSTTTTTTRRLRERKPSRASIVSATPAGVRERSASRRGAAAGPGAPSPAPGCDWRSAGPREPPGANRRRPEGLRGAGAEAGRAG